jgi:hypothetical protein
MYLPIPYKIKYDTEKFSFRETIEKMLNESSLEKLHLKEKINLIVRETDQKTKWHELYYSKYAEEFKSLYESFVRHLAETFEYSEIIYQKIPTFRIHQVENLGVGEWHKDKTYQHGVSEVNFWLPFVDTYDTNTIWTESKEDLGDYSPYDVKYGEVLVFSGANLQHGNKINTTEDTRVSVDFRLVDPNKFVQNNNSSINGITNFTIGGYFEKISL